MTISTTTIKNSFSGNASTSAFTYTFKISASSEMQVIIRTGYGETKWHTRNGNGPEKEKKWNYS